MQDWEQHYLEEHTPWEKGEPSPGLVDYLAEAPIGGRVVAPGCGLGHDVRAIVAANPEAEVIGLDVAPSAVAKADAFPKIGKERFEVGDWFNLSADLTGSCDWVFEHTCFCAIDPSQRDDYVQAARSALKPGGKLLGVFYLDPYDDEHPKGVDHPPYGAELEVIEAHFAPFFEILESYVPKRAFPGREEREQLMVMQLKN
ncbi:MAG: methyltransferase [Verrucomicrobiota bacterium]